MNHHCISYISQNNVKYIMISPSDIISSKMGSYKCVYKMPQRTMNKESYKMHYEVLSWNVVGLTPVPPTPDDPEPLALDGPPGGNGYDTPLLVARDRLRVDRD
jgi:hypothetical protein